MPIITPLSDRDYPGGRILVVGHADGWIEHYCRSRAVDIHYATMPTVSRANEATAQELLAAQLPQVYRDIYYPGYLRATHLVETVTATDLAVRTYDMQVLRALTTMEGRSR